MKNKLRKVILFIKQFGFLFTFKYYYYKMFKKDDKYIKLITNYLSKYLRPIIDKYNEFDKEYFVNDIETNNSLIPVWVCWWQGYEKMPELCKMFYNRLKKMLPKNSELKLITIDNYLDYASIPNFIVERFNNKQITMTTYSDVLRNYLIRDNGGLWIDASIFVSKNISEEFINEKKWWSVNLSNKNQNIENIGQKISNRKWSGFLQKGDKGNIINSYVCDAFDYYYLNHEILIDYFIQNLFIKIAYENIPSIRKIIDSVEINNTNVYSLYDNIDLVYDKEEFDFWNSDTTFFKMTQKRSYCEYNENNKITFYGHIKKMCDESDDK